MAENIALVELGDTHQECLYTQLVFLKEAGYKVTLVVSKKLFANIHYPPAWDYLYLHELQGSKSLWKLFQISRYLKKNRVTKIVFNTAENAVVRNFLFMTYGVECYGILHDVSKLGSSGNQKFISRRIKKYFILNDYLLNSIAEENRARVASFYPVFFPDTPAVAVARKKPGEIRIIIPGQLELKRRDYLGLIEAAEKARLKHIRFVLLGNGSKGDGKLIADTIAAKKLGDRFMLFDGYLSEDEFHSYIRGADLVMPLIHPGSKTGPRQQEDSSNYLTRNISGAFNFAFGYKKPMLTHDAFSAFDDFQASSFFYNPSSLAALLKKLDSSPARIRKMTLRLKKYEKFSRKYQYESYIGNL